MYTDRYYTSLPLAMALKGMKIHFTGVVTSNRIALSEEVKGKNLKALQKLKKKKTFQSPEDDVLVFAWRDKRNIIILSSFHNNKSKIIKRKVKDKGEDKILKPYVICDYNMYTGVVDKLDRYVSSYNFSRKSLEWWR